MNARRLAIFLTATALTVSNAGRAADPLGLYIGGSVGQSTLRDVPFAQGPPVSTDPVPFAGHDTGWQLLVGLHPISFIGAELNYIDFGEIRPSIPSAGVQENISANLRARAPAVFGMGYLPIPLPFLEVFVKAGVAHLQTTDNFSGAGGFCKLPGALLCDFSPYSFNQSGTYFAYGVGAQLKFAAIGIRAEYERIAASGGDPDLLSLGLTWSL